MFRYTFLVAAIIISAISACTADDKNSIIYEKYLPDGSIARVMKRTSFPESDAEKDYQTDRYSMIITGGKSGKTAVWSKELRIRKADSQNPGTFIRIHDVQVNRIHDEQVKGDLTVILFTKGGETFAEVTGAGKTLFSKSLAGKSPSSAMSIKQGQMVCFEDDLYAVAVVYIVAVSESDDTVLWILQNTLVKTEIITRIRGPFHSSEIISDKYLYQPAIIFRNNFSE